MDASYFKAAIPEPYRIFGLRLLPLSLGRYRLLERFHCAFVGPGEACATIQDLLLGILICSMPCREFLELIEDGKLFAKQLRRLGKRMQAEVRADPYFSILAKYGLFKAYIAESSAAPQYWDESPNSAGSGAHWAQSLEVLLRGELGYTAAEIEEGPLSKAISDSFKLAENQGLIRIIDAEEIEQGNNNAALFAQFAKEAPCPV